MSESFGNFRKPKAPLCEGSLPAIITAGGPVGFSYKKVRSGDGRAWQFFMEFYRECFPK